MGSTRFDSQNSIGLLVAEFAAGAIGGRYEHGDSTYYDIIAHKVVSERRLFFS